MSPALYSPHKERLLSSLQYQAKSNDCGPYTTATVLNAFRNLDIDAEKLAREMDKPVWRGPLFVIRRIPHWATFPWGIVDILKSYGLDASWHLLVSKPYLRNGLGQGKVLMPIIGSIFPLWAHVMSLIAWDATQGWGFANTQSNHRHIYWLSDETFTRQWQVMLNMLVEIRNA